MPKHKLASMVPQIISSSFEHAAACFSLLCADIQAHPGDAAQIKIVKTLMQQAVSMIVQQAPGHRPHASIYFNQLKAAEVLRSVILECSWDLTWYDIFQYALSSFLAEKIGRFSKAVIRALARSITSESSLVAPDWESRYVSKSPCSIVYKY
jgi:hypothetical protein